MAFIEALGISEGLQVFLIALTMTIVTLFLIRYLSFYHRFRKVRKENMEMVSDIKKRLKTAKLRSIDELIDEQDDEMFQKAARAKPLAIPATYEARIAKTRSKALKKRKAGRRKAPRPKARTRRKKSR